MVCATAQEMPEVREESEGGAMPKENLAKSIDTAITFQKLLEQSRTILRQLVDQTPELNDEVILLMVGTHNGLGSMLVKLFEVMELLTQRKAIFGDEGIEKKLAARFQEDDEPDEPETPPETPDEEADYYDDSDDDEEEIA